MTKLTLCFLLSVSLLACAAEHDTGSNNPLKSGVNVDKISFADVSASVLQSRCVKCHQQYANYSSVFAELAAIKSAVERNSMPKDGPLTLEQKNFLLAWINSGAPEFADNTGPVPKPPEDILEPTWDSLSRKVFFPKCTVCHNPNGQAKFLDLSTRDAIFAARNREFSGRKLIDFERPERSYLVEVVLDDDEPMPPVWSNLEVLTAEEVMTIQDWIVLGLP